MEATFCWLISWSTNHIRSVKLVTVCFHMLCRLLNVLEHHLWVQFSKSTLFIISSTETVEKETIFAVSSPLRTIQTMEGEGSNVSLWVLTTSVAMLFARVAVDQTCIAPNSQQLLAQIQVWAAGLQEYI